jgi:hypothetical protein
VQALRHDPAHVGGEQGHQHLGEAVLGEGEGTPCDLCHREPHRHPDDRCEEEQLEPVGEGKGSVDRGGHRGPVEHEGGGVVDQALALEDHYHPVGNVQAPPDGGGGHRVGGRDDGAESEGFRPADTGDDPVRGRGHRGGGGGHEADGEEGDGGQVGAKIPERGKVGGGPQDGRKEDEEDEIGIEPQHGHLGELAEGEAAHHEQDGIGEKEASRQRGQAQHGHEEDDGDLEVLEAGHLLDAHPSKRRAAIRAVRRGSTAGRVARSL